MDDQFGTITPNTVTLANAPSLQFHKNGEEIGRLFIKDGHLHFEGTMPPTEAAQIFIDECNRRLSE